MPRIDEQDKKCKQIIKKLQDWCVKLEKMEAYLIELKNKSYEMEANLQVRIENLAVLYERAVRDKEELKEQKKKITEMMNQRTNDVKDWCWVPFYNLYLLKQREDALARFKEE